MQLGIWRRRYMPARYMAASVYGGVGGPVGGAVYAGGAKTNKNTVLCIHRTHSQSGKENYTQ